MAAEQCADQVRKTLAVDRGPLRNKALGELFDTRKESFRQSIAERNALPYGMRVGRDNSPADKIAARSRWSHDRRFEIARALGDAIFDSRGRIGPMGEAGTARQKFQKAFAQSLLCPLDDLIGYLGDDASDSALSATALHFHVSEHMIRTVLVNKKFIGRERLLGSDRRTVSDGDLEAQAEAARGPATRQGERRSPGA